MATLCTFCLTCSQPPPNDFIKLLSVVILLDIDGVLVNTAPWQKVEILPDGFMKFDEVASRNLDTLLRRTAALADALKILAG